MRLHTIAGALALAGTSFALPETSPFVLFSTEVLLTTRLIEGTSFAMSEKLMTEAKAVLSYCPTDRYVLLSQAGARASDLIQDDDCGVPRLCSAIKDERVANRFIVPEVVGTMSADGLSGVIKAACERKGKTPVIEEAHFSSLPDFGRISQVSNNDMHMGHYVDQCMEGGSCTVLYISTPSEPSYESEFEQALPQELKRDLRSEAVRRADNETDWNKLPLFEKYQFFTPGIFMGIIAAIVLLSILGGGLAALSSLEIPYGAFDKDVGPGAQKKQ